MNFSKAFYSLCTKPFFSLFILRGFSLWRLYLQQEIHMLERDGKDVTTRCSEKWDRTRKATCSVQQLLESFKNKLHNIFGNFTYTFFKSNFTSKKRNSMKNILIRKVYALVCRIFKRS